MNRVLDFWFLPDTHPEFGEHREAWWQKDATFDAEIRQNFEELVLKAENGDLLSWTESAKGCMALIILLDQFPRNIYRDTARAFSFDGKAREIARHTMDRGYFDQLPEIMQFFALLPFEHSESLEDQKFSVESYKKLGNENGLDFAIRHLEIIERFGRFPHRNEILGRTSTAEEIEFLQQPNSSF
ncbi:DUF924 family protein [Sneathiella sp. P13V-1]|nr:DUF924 family protein [Sneathiella sp. P13V-1]